MYDNFFNKFESFFYLEKLKKDLFDYLDGDNTVMSSHEISGNTKINILEKDDIFTIGSIKITKKYQGQNFLPYSVELIIGKYDNTLGVILADKFVAEMFYDFNYELVTIDFIHHLEIEQ